MASPRLLPVSAPAALLAPAAASLLSPRRHCASLSLPPAMCAGARQPAPAPCCPLAANSTPQLPPAPSRRPRLQRAAPSIPAPAVAPPPPSLPPRSHHLAPPPSPPRPRLPAPACSHLQVGVGVAEGDDGDVHVGRLLDRLVVGAGVGHNQQARLLKPLLDLVGEGACGARGPGGGAGRGSGRSGGRARQAQRWVRQQEPEGGQPAAPAEPRWHARPTAACAGSAAAAAAGRPCCTTAASYSVLCMLSAVRRQQQAWAEDCSASACRLLPTPCQPALTAS